MLRRGLLLRLVQQLLHVLRCSRRRRPACRDELLQLLLLHMLQLPVEHLHLRLQRVQDRGEGVDVSCRGEKTQRHQSVHKFRVVTGHKSDRDQADSHLRGGLGAGLTP